MPGILVGINADRPHSGAAMQRRLRAAVDPEEEVRFEDFGAGWAVASAGRPSHALSRITDPEGTIVWGFGRVFPNANDSPMIRRLLSQPLADAAALLLREEGWPALGELDGEFNLIVWEPRTRRLTVTGDRYGLRPWYVREIGSQLWLAPSVRQLLTVDDTPIRLDDHAVGAYLAYSRLRLGNRTLVDGVTALPPAARWEIDCASGRVTRAVYWRMRFSDAMTDGEASDDQIEGLCEAFKSGVQRRIAGSPGLRFGISLSGGLDSRAVAAAIPQELLPKIWSSTCGLPDSDEVKLAVDVARKAGFRHDVFPLYAGDYVNAADRSFQFNDGLDLFVQAAQGAWLEDASSKADVFLTGLAMDMTLGGAYLTPDVMAARELSDLRTVIQARHSVFGSIDIANVVHASRTAAVSDEAWDAMHAELEATGQQSATGAHENVVHSARVRRLIMARHASIRRYMGTMAVTYDRGFLDQVLALPLTWRAEHRTYARFICRLSPALATLPYQRTLVPATVPVEFWKIAADVERQREQLYLDIWKATGGQIALPYRRYYTNFDEWLRTDPRWRQLIDDTLLSRSSLVYQLGVLDPEGVAAVVVNGRAGDGGCRTAVIVLASLELYLRQMLNPAS